MSDSEPNIGDLPTNGFIILNRQGKTVFHLGINPPTHREGAETLDTLDLEQLKSLILRHPAALIRHTSVRLYQKHSEGDEDEAINPVNYNEVWDTERPEEAHNFEEHPSQPPDDDVGHTQEIFLLVGVISDPDDHSGDMGCVYGCPLQRNICIIHLPAGIVWADLKGLVTDISNGTSKREIQDATDRIDYARGLMGEWSNLLEVEWFDEMDKSGKVKVCRILLEVTDDDPDVFPPWSDTFDDGATNLRRIEFAYQSTLEEESEQEVAVEVEEQQAGKCNIDIV
jgi:hypothetical protein